MTNIHPARALTADWLNAWLAAIGVTVLIPGVRLRWADEPLPHAVFDTPGGPPLAEQVAHALPTADDLRVLAIARSHPETTADFPRNIGIDAYRERCAVARRSGDPSLALSVTDLARDTRDAHLRHSHFDPPAPKGITLHDRLMGLRRAIPDDSAPEAVQRALTASGQRVKGNGLGFDYRRIVSPTDPGGDVWVDPVVELLAYFGLALFPVRGDGTRMTVRGWQPGPPKRGSLTWPAWHPPLTAAGIDALLDQHWHGKHQTQNILATYSVVPYQPRGQMDQTRAFASERAR